MSAYTSTYEYAIVLENKNAKEREKRTYGVIDEQLSV